MKKLLALLLAGILVFALVGCNDAEVSEEADNSGYSEELDEAEDVVDKINMTYGDDETKITLYKPEGAFFSVDPEDADDAFVEGMNKVYKQLMTELDNLGVKPIEAVGQEFDPNLHNAVMQCESEEYESGVVAQELLKGYTYRDSVVRHSMVSVTI